MKWMAPLYMVRQGETAWNPERRMPGPKNSALTERGRAQAVAMGQALKAELAREPGPTLFLRSPLGRTCETALIVGRALGLDPAQWRDDPRPSSATASGKVSPGTRSRRIIPMRS